MAYVTVAQLAEVVGVSEERMLMQFKEAGLPQRSAKDIASDHDRQVLLAYLKNIHSSDSEVSEDESINSKSVINSQDNNLGRSRGSDSEAKNKIKVFISYSYDSPEHEIWVEQLATMLRSDGIESILDKWYLHHGDPITKFMEESIVQSNFVLIICTEKYKYKSDKRIGGVGYEESIISSDMLSNSNHRKYIPVLKSNSYSSSVPTALHSKKYVDLSNDEAFGLYYRDLLLTLYGRRPKAPPIGDIPEHIFS